MIKSIQTYEDKWVKWWTEAQPKWRNTRNWPFPQDDVGTGDWDDLFLGGKDGLYIVVMSLSWWAHARDPVVDSKVEDAISDVCWVMGHLITSLSAVTAYDSTPPATPPPPTNHPEPTTKRRRTRG